MVSEPVTTPSKAPVTRHLYIISRRHPELYSYLRARFAEDETVGVILDRRLTAQHLTHEVRAWSSDGSQERRTRREGDLKAHSHAIITIPEVS